MIIHASKLVVALTKIYFTRSLHRCSIHNLVIHPKRVIHPRERLYELFHDGIERKPFAQWTPSDKKSAEMVSRQFELVGLLIGGRLFDPGLFLRSWYRTVEKCWAACEEMVVDRRQRQNDPGLWSHFEELDALAKTCRPSIAKMLGYEPAEGVATENESTYTQTMVKMSK